MANLLNISKTYYWQLEHDQRRLSYEMALKIAKIFDKKPDDIFYQEYFEKNKVTFYYSILMLQVNQLFS